jgi:hypothetical protein
MMHFATKRLSELRVGLAGHDWARLWMHMQAGIEQTQRSTSKPYLSTLGDALGGHHQTILEEYMEVVNLKVIDLKAVNLEAGNPQAVNLDAVNLLELNLEGVTRKGVNLDAIDQQSCAIEAETLFID